MPRRSMRRGESQILSGVYWRVNFASRKPLGVSVNDPRMHDAEAKKSMDARLARVEGQVHAVRRMIAGDEPCENIAQQLSAARRALDRAFYEMVSCMIRHDPATGVQARSDHAGRVAALLARFG